MVLGIRRLKAAITRAKAAPQPSGAPKSAGGGGALKKQKTEPAITPPTAAKLAPAKTPQQPPSASTSHLLGRGAAKASTGSKQPVMADKPVSSMPSIESLPEPTAGDTLNIRQGLEYDTLISKLTKQVADLSDVRFASPHERSRPV